jgi:glycosyltransferase involved in cell wall biosynthesis
VINKVIHINDNIDLRGGVEVYVEQVARLLPGIGWQTDWLGVRRNGKRVEVSRYGNPGWAWRGDLRALVGFLRGELHGCDAGLLHLHNLSDPQLVRACFAVAPVVRTMHEPRMFCPGQGKFWHASEIPCPKPFGLHCLAHAYTQRCCNRHPKRLLAGILNARFEVGEGAHAYAVVIANSHFMKDQAVLAGMPETKITVLPCFTEETAESDADLSLATPRIVFAGRLSKTKGVHYLLEALALVRKLMPDVRLDIAGAGGDQDYFVNLTDRLGLAQAVTFHGWCNRQTVASLLKDSWVVAFPSICPEAFGMTGIEAMMQGRPVVAFDVGGVGEWLQHGVTGLLVTSKDANAFSEALLRLLRNSQERLAMGRAARAVARRNFSIENHLNNLHSLYGRVVAKSR